MTKSILVSGAGIAGISVCYWLEQFGFSPVLIEKAPAIRTGGQALDIRGVVVGLAQKMGIYKACCEYRTQIEHGLFVDKNGQVLYEEEGEKVGFRHDDEVELQRGDLVRILMEQLQTTPCHFNHHITKLSQTPEGVTVTDQHGTTAQYDLVIGTDGIHSSIRRMVFSDTEYQSVDLGSYLAFFTIPNYLKLRHTEMAYETEHKFLLMGSDRDADLARVIFMLRSDEKLTDIRDVQEQKQFLRSHFQGFGWEADRILGQIDESEDFYFDQIVQIDMPCWTKDRVALVGDAGYCASPLSGQGNNLAMVGAYVLAGELKAADGNYARAFARYEQVLRPFVKVNQAFGRSVSETFLTDATPTKQQAESRLTNMLSEIRKISHGITLPHYER